MIGETASTERVAVSIEQIPDAIDLYEIDAQSHDLHSRAPYLIRTAVGSNLFDGDRLREVTRLIDVVPPQSGDVIGEKL